VQRRNRYYDRGKGVRRLPVPVISIGNLTTGGSGKTPMVDWVVMRLIEHGHRPLIAMRGYGAAAGETSDEAIEHAERLPGTPVVADPRRFEAVTSYLDGDERIDGVVLDDGFQHRQLARDLDVVLIDATAGTLTDCLVPAGNLREPPASLRRADAVVVTHADEVDDDLAAAIERHGGSRPVAWTRPRWSGLRVFENGHAERVGVEWLAGKRVLTMLGIARPQRVRRHLDEAGAIVAANVPARDHERYDQAKLIAAHGHCADVDALLVTGKDWAKLEPMVTDTPWPVPVVVPRLEVEFVEGEAALDELVAATIAV
jgi:tetraacyldisaccharide 4'-kinase